MRSEVQGVADGSFSNKLFHLLVDVLQVIPTAMLHRLDIPCVILACTLAYNSSITRRQQMPRNHRQQTLPRVSTSRKRRRALRHSKARSRCWTTTRRRPELRWKPTKRRQQLRRKLRKLSLPNAAEIEPARVSQEHSRPTVAAKKTI